VRLAGAPGRVPLDDAMDDVFAQQSGQAPAVRRARNPDDRRHGPRVQRRAVYPLAVDLLRKYRTNLLAGVLGFRAMAGAPAQVILVGVYGLREVLYLEVVWLVMVAANVAVIPLVMRRRSLTTAGVLPWLVLDSVVAVVLNLWSAAVVPGSVNEPFHDAFFFWCMGTAVLWTAWFGWWAGATASVLSVPLQLGMTALSGGEPIRDTLPMLIGRTTWLLVGVLAGSLVLWVMRLAADGVRAEGLRAGQKAAQLEVLRKLHDTALQTLEAIRLTVENERLEPALRLERIGEAARWKAADIRTVLRAHDDEQQVDALDAVTATVREAADGLRSAGVRVHLRAQHRDTVRLDAQHSEALCDGIREALNNVRKHAAATSVVVDTSVRSDRLEVSVSDDGHGFDPDRAAGFGIRHSLIERVEETGGTIEIRSAPGRGTRVVVRVSR
jgi:signal transduction histidine kinase